MFRKIFCKNYIDTEFDENILSPEEKAEIEAEYEAGYKEDSETKPNLNPLRTALFTSYVKKTPVNCFNEKKFRRKIRLDCGLLLVKGYDTFFVNCGTNYGVLAMEELLRMRNEGYTFSLYSGKVSRERQSLLKNLLQFSYLCVECDQRYFMLTPIEFARYVITQVSAISTESGLFKTYQKIPAEARSYYLELDKQFREAANRNRSPDGKQDDLK